MSGAINEERAVQRVAELVRAEQSGVRLRSLVIGPFSGYMLIGALQLVLRHPTYAEGGMMAKTIEQVARDLLGLFDGDAEVQQLLLAGFDRTLDHDTGDLA